ncbi:MAG: NADH-quinone oxidoreductase subunit NuoB [Alicyclobacillus sp.]|nr:NADH-quinone oxidoreductase subunit NuoB [Alicyclobacillus sp.]
MLANWLRAGVGSGRVTTRYPHPTFRDEDGCRAWHTVAAGGARPCLAAACDCAQICPTGAIRFRTDLLPEVDAAACIGCGRCIEACPEGVFAWSDRIDQAMRYTARAEDVAQRDWDELDAAAAGHLQSVFRRSLHVRHIDVGSCNACESEVLALSNPYYNFHRLGIFFTASPRHADVLLVTGALTPAMREVLVATYEAMPRPRLVVAAGVCSLHGGVFRESAQFVGPLDQVIPVDVMVPGCPPTPYAILRGLLEAATRREKVATHG